jgi:NAD(P)-dependent dehydrogenase (short-subunit alcohol dehydrogenase family)
MAISFKDRVVIVTGAGGGLGRAHALALAKLGAKVVINDLGGALDGSGGNSAAAEKVVAEITAAGGEAIANGASVSDDAGVAHLVKQTMDKWGRIDVLIANAGILRDKSFGKMELKDFTAVMDVHLLGTVKPCKAVWEIMKAQGYGRIVVTTSSTGLYGNFGQTNYGAAKSSLVGFMHSLKLEGAKDNIRVNAICPVAATRMTENLLPPAIQQAEQQMARERHAFEMQKLAHERMTHAAQAGMPAPTMETATAQGHQDNVRSLAEAAAMIHKAANTRRRIVYGPNGRPVGVEPIPEGEAPQ